MTTPTSHDCGDLEMTQRYADISWSEENQEPQARPIFKDMFVSLLKEDLLVLRNFCPKDHTWNALEAATQKLVNTAEKMEILMSTGLSPVLVNETISQGLLNSSEPLEVFTERLVNTLNTSYDMEGVYEITSKLQNFLTHEISNQKFASIAEAQELASQDWQKLKQMLSGEFTTSQMENGGTATTDSHASSWTTTTEVSPSTNYSTFSTDILTRSKSKGVTSSSSPLTYGSLPIKNPTDGTKTKAARQLFTAVSRSTGGVQLKRSKRVWTEMNESSASSTTLGSEDTLECLCMCDCDKCQLCECNVCWNTNARPYTGNPLK